MQCQDIMKKVVEISPDATVRDAALRLREATVAFLPVCDASHRLIGAISEHELSTRIVAEGKGLTTPVREVMSTRLLTCHQTDSLRDAEAMMAASHQPEMICVDEAGLAVGVVELAEVVLYEPTPRAEEFEKAEPAEPDVPPGERSLADVIAVPSAPVPGWVAVSRNPEWVSSRWFYFLASGAVAFLFAVIAVLTLFPTQG